MSRAVEGAAVVDRRLLTGTLAGTLVSPNARLLEAVVEETLAKAALKPQPKRTVKPKQTAKKKPRQQKAKEKPTQQKAKTKGYCAACGSRVYEWPHINHWVGPRPEL